VQFVCVHATPRDPLYEYLGPDAESWKDRVQGIAADAILVGHTHLQFRLDLGDRVVVNPGSLGQPKDGDPRAAYALIDDGRVTLHRVAYDVEATVAQLAACAIPARAIAELSALLRTGRVPQQTAPTEVGAAGAISEEPRFDGDPL
ncbi:MAG: metallophosphoesterase family protein, partial [Gemmatimonadaceae bacterium]